MKIVVQSALLFAAAAPGIARTCRGRAGSLLTICCVECHDTDAKKGGLGFDRAPSSIRQNSTNFSRWVLVHDRVMRRREPPKKKARPDSAAAKPYQVVWRQSLTEAEDGEVGEGKVARRSGPAQSLPSMKARCATCCTRRGCRCETHLPEDGKADRFTRFGDALDVSQRSDGAVSLARRITPCARRWRPRPSGPSGRFSVTTRATSAVTRAR